MKKKLLSVLLALVLSFSVAPMSLGAATKSSDYTKEEQHKIAEEFADCIEELLDLIIDKYTGGDFDFDRMLDEAIYGIMYTLDPYSTYYDRYYQEFSYVNESLVYGLGIYLDINYSGQIYVADMLIDSPADKAGVQIGDVLLKIDGKAVADMTMTQLADKIESLGNKMATYVFLRNGKEVTFKMQREEFEVSAVHMYKMEDILAITPTKETDKVRYISISIIEENTAADFAKCVKLAKEQGVTKIIMDLRDNPGGYVEEAVEICRQIVPEGQIIKTVDKNKREKVYSSELKEKTFETIFVLTNEGTASSAEIIASAIKESGAGKTYGTKTYGKGIIQAFFGVTTGGLIKMTVEEYFTRNNNKIHGIGVKPDVEVKPAKPDYIAEEIYEKISDVPQAEVIKIKKALALLEMYTGPINGVYDKELQDVIKFIQEDFGYDAEYINGIADPFICYFLNFIIDMYQGTNSVIEKAFTDILVVK